MTNLDDLRWGGPRVARAGLWADATDAAGGWCLC